MTPQMPCFLAFSSRPVTPCHAKSRVPSGFFRPLPWSTGRFCPSIVSLYIYGGEWKEKPDMTDPEGDDEGDENDPENRLSGVFDPLFTGPAGTVTPPTRLQKHKIN